MYKEKVQNWILFSLILLLSSYTNAQEGMWIPALLENNEAEMKAMGMEMDVEDIYNLEKSSLKDAIVHFGGFCTGEIISNKGLVLTNHHCGYGQIQSLSSVENNYLEDGYWASSGREELKCEGLFVTFIKEIIPLTDQVLAGVNENDSEAVRDSKIKANMDSIKAKFTFTEFQDLIIKPFYQGNEYFGFLTERYDDIRLVGTPPSSIGKFGADTDNWSWPRHTGDFALFRIYANYKNEPAAYHKNNVPYQPKHHLPISLDGVDEEDFTLIFGFPGSTNQYLPAEAIKQLVNEINPSRILVRDKALNIIDKEMRKNESVKIQYASKFARIANYWKKWKGENLGLTQTNAIENIKKYESDFQAKIQNLEDGHPYKTVLPALNKTYKQYSEAQRASAVYGEIINRNLEAARLAGYFNRAAEMYESGGEEAYNSFMSRLIPYAENIYKNYNLRVEKKVAEELFVLYREIMPLRTLPSSLPRNESTIRSKVSILYSASAIGSGDIMRFVKDSSAAKAVEKINSDALGIFISECHDAYSEQVIDKLSTFNHHRDSLLRIYTKAQKEYMSEGHRLYPDANSTLRVGYGQVKGYYPRDGVRYLPKTYLDGVIEKYIPDDYEFDVPDKLLELYESKDFGPYTENGKVPVCFLGSNHTTGGNSGSPAIDAHGNLIGLNFDRVWEGTMSDYYYDIKYCRNIMVDARYILFIIDKFAGAKHLVDEMTLVHPKSDK